MIFALILLSVQALELREEECPCKEEDLGDKKCNSKCDIEACGFDGGDCAVQICECSEDQIGDGICDWNCVNPSCNYDDGDCCENWMLYDNFCDAACYLEKFKMDNNNCKHGIKQCQWVWELVFDGVCQYEISDHPECLDDMGDCCFTFEIGDGHCEEYCYSPTTEWDGGDCIKDAPTDCPCWGEGKLGTGTCDEECNNAQCWYDMGDCCTPEMLGDSNCDEACNDEYHDYDGGDCLTFLA